MRLAIAVVVGAAGALCAFACATVSLDLGRDDGPSAEIDATNDAGVDAPIAAATPTLLERLKARCAAPAGPADYYDSAAALSTRVAGRWYFCPDRGGGWYAPRPEGLELRLDGVPTWAFLTYDGEAGGFRAASDVSSSGPLRYVVPAFRAAEAGVDAGVDEMEVAPSDTTPRNGIQLWLEIPDGAFQFIPDFEKDPRLMQLRELGGDPARGVFVPID